LVSFGQKQRYIGEAAKTQEISNFKNTVGSLKRIIGRTFQDREVQEMEKPYINAELVDVNGQVGAKVRHNNFIATFFPCPKLHYVVIHDVIVHRFNISVKIITSAQLNWLPCISTS
jgi:hypothetical protein